MKRALSVLLLIAFVFTLSAACPMQARAASDHSVIRVKLSAGTNSGDDFSAEFTPNGNYYLYENPMYLPSGQKYTVRKENGALSLYLGSELLVTNQTTLSIRQCPPDSGKTNTIRIQNTNYLGDMIFKLVSGTGYVINSLYLEQYLYGVLAGEMGNTFPLEALKAQAVASRSYAIAHMGTGSYDLDDTSNRQVYRGYNADYTNCIKAVNDTAKQVLQYNGNIIEAYFGASNGGITELPTHVWPNNPTSINGPYRIVSDEYDTKNPLSEWQRIYFPAAMSASDPIAFSKRSGSGSTTPVAATNAANYLKLLAFNSFSGTDKATYNLLSANDIVLKGVTAMSANTPAANHTDQCRDFTMASATVSVQVTDTLGTPQILSKDVTIDLRELSSSGSTYKTFTDSRRLMTVEPVSENGSTVGYAIYNRGFGGGMGLSQRGAQQRANEGQTYMDILAFYYPNCPLTDGHYPTVSISEPSVATPAIPQYTVSAVPENAALGMTSGGCSVTGGTLATVQATPKAFCTFVQWREGSTVLTTDASYSFHVARDRTLTAVFASSFRVVSASFNSIQLSWNRESSASGYEVYRSASQNGTYSLLASTTSTGYLNSGLTTGVTYYYKVRAYHMSGSTKVYGEYSTIASAQPSPSAPASIKAAPASYSSIKLSWAGVSGRTGYKVYRAASPTGTFALVATTSSTSYTNTKVNVGTTYYYKVQAYRSVGKTKVYGGFSSVASAVTALSSPSSLKATASTYNSIKLSWKSVTGKSGYEVFRSESQSGPFAYVGSASSTAFTNINVNTGSAYYYQVRAYRLVGSTRVYGGFSPIASAKTSLSVPKSVKASRANATSIRVKWGSVSGANGYELFRSASKTGSYAQVVSTTSASFVDTGLTTGTRYYYKVMAYRLVGGAKVYSAFSAIVNAKP